MTRLRTVMSATLTPIGESMIVVALEEEYGYRQWLWYFEGTEDELVACWQQRRAPTNFFNPSKGNYEGKVFEVIPETLDLYRSCEIRAHAHMPDDSYLAIRNDYYPYPEQPPPP